MKQSTLIMVNLNHTILVMVADCSDPSEFFYLDLVYDDSHSQEWSK